MVCHRANPPRCHLFLLRTLNKPHGLLPDENKGSMCTFSLVNAVFSLSGNGSLPEDIPLHQAAWSFLPNLRSTCKVPASLVFPASPLAGSPLGSPRKPQAFSSAQDGAALGSAGTQLCGGVAVSPATSHTLLGTSGGPTVLDLKYSCFMRPPTRSL